MSRHRKTWDEIQAEREQATQGLRNLWEPPLARILDRMSATLRRWDRALKRRRRP